MSATLALLLFPAGAFADGRREAPIEAASVSSGTFSSITTSASGTFTGTTMSASGAFTGTVTEASSGTFTGASSGDVRHVISQTLGTEARDVPEARDFSATLDGIDVTALCSRSYRNNKAADTATATVAVRDGDGGNLTARATFSITLAKMNAIALKTVQTYPTSLRFPEQTAAGAGKAPGITFDVYLREAKSGAKWVKKLGGIASASAKAKTRAITGLGAKKAYQYQIRATRKVGGVAVATSTWTSGTVKTGAKAAPKIKSAKASGVRVFKKGKKAYTSYKLKVTLSKPIGNGTAGIVTDSGTRVAGKGRSFTVAFKNVAGNKRGKTATVRLRGYTSKAYGGYTNLSKAFRYRIG